MHESIRKAARWTERIFAILGVILTAVIMTALLTGPHRPAGPPAEPAAQASTPPTSPSAPAGAAIERPAVSTAPVKISASAASPSSSPAQMKDTDPCALDSTARSLDDPTPSLPSRPRPKDCPKPAPPTAEEKAIDELGLPWSACIAPTRAESDKCKKEQAEFQPQALGARRGDYWKQRNVARCLSKGCGGLYQDQISACAWRIIIVASGRPQVDSGDVRNMQLDCGRLDDAGRFAAKAKGRAMFVQIYGSSMID